MKSSEAGEASGRVRLARRCAQNKSESEHDSTSARFKRCGRSSVSGCCRRGWSPSTDCQHPTAPGLRLLGAAAEDHGGLHVCYLVLSPFLHVRLDANRQHPTRSLRLDGRPDGLGAYCETSSDTVRLADAPASFAGGSDDPLLPTPLRRRPSLTLLDLCRSVPKTHLL